MINIQQLCTKSGVSGLLINDEHVWTYEWSCKWTPYTDVKHSGLLFPVVEDPLSNVYRLTLLLVFIYFFFFFQEDTFREIGLLTNTHYLYLSNLLGGSNVFDFLLYILYVLKYYDENISSHIRRHKDQQHCVMISITWAIYLPTWSFILFSLSHLYSHALPTVLRICWIKIASAHCKVKQLDRHNLFFFFAQVSQHYYHPQDKCIFKMFFHPSLK